MSFEDLAAALERYQKHMQNLSHPDLQNATIAEVCGYMMHVRACTCA